MTRTNQLLDALAYAFIDGEIESDRYIAILEIINDNTILKEN